MKAVLSMLIAVLALVAIAPAAASAAGSISGTVKDFTSGNGVAGVEACAENQVTFDETCSALTGADGKYKIDLGEGKYEVAFFPEDGVGYLPQWYKEHDLRPVDPELITVETSEVPGVDARLKRGGTIEGQVTDAVSHAGLAGAEVCVNLNGDSLDRCFDAGAGGNYVSPTLTPGNYTVSFWDEDDEYLPVWYDQASAAGAKLVTVTAGNAKSGINGALSKGSSISGTVREAGSGNPLDEIIVCLHDTVGDESPCVFSNSAGVYKFGALPNGKYKVGFSEEPDPIFKDAFDTEFFDDVASLDLATVLQIGTKTTITQIDASLQKTGSGGGENPPPSGGGGQSGGAGGGGAQTPPASRPGPVATKTLKCKKGFKKKTVKGKSRCVKKKKHAKKGH